MPPPASRLRIRPTAPVPAALACLVWALLAAGPGCSCDDTGLGRTLPPGARIDTFQQAEVSRLDILWVVDNSRSMIEEQQNLAENLLSFFRYLDQGDVDYQIAVTTTDAVNDAGRFVGRPEVLTPLTPNVLDAFRGNIQVGIEGRAQEQGLEAALLALSERNPSFLRDEAYLFVIFVSDEDDSSFGELRYFWRVFEQLKGIGNEEKVSLSAIVGPPSDPETGEEGGCSSENGQAAPGDRYVELALATGGLWGSICDASFATTLEALGAKAVGLKRKFVLSTEADPESIEVSVVYPCEGRPEEIGRCETVEDTCSDPDPKARAYRCIPPKGRPNGWEYEAETNAIFFWGDSVPGLKAIIEVVYKKRPKELKQ
ncbi:MAG: VWA domain-containing protein [Deltaproteobacteria bacterium]|nr:MAG: VWA domain-containing protein [Deltaproteobacteria bacterium]